MTERNTLVRTLAIILFLHCSLLYAQNEFLNSQSWTTKSIRNPALIDNVYRTETGLCIKKALVPEKHYTREWDYYLPPLFTTFFYNHSKLNNGIRISASAIRNAGRNDNTLRIGYARYINLSRWNRIVLGINSGIEHHSEYYYTGFSFSIEEKLYPSINVGISYMAKMGYAAISMSHLSGNSYEPTFFIDLCKRMEIGQYVLLDLNFSHMHQPFPNATNFNALITFYHKFLIGIGRRLPEGIALHLGGIIQNNLQITGTINIRNERFLYFDPSTVFYPELSIIYRAYIPTCSTGLKHRKFLGI